MSTPPQSRRWSTASINWPLRTRRLTLYQSLLRDVVDAGHGGDHAVRQTWGTGPG